MTPTDELPPFETRLLAELSDVVEERRRTAEAERVVVRPRRTRLAVATAGVAVLALAIAVAPGLTRDNGSRAFAIRELEGGVIELDIFDPDLEGDALAAELGEFGIEVAVERWQASPSAVGRVEAFLGGGPEPFVPWQERAGITLPDAEGSIPYRVRIDPDVYEGDVVIRFMVETPPGEPYTMREEVFEPGEVLGGLHCALGEPIRPEQLVPYLDELGLDAVWETIRPEPDGSYFHESVDGLPDGQVLWGYALDNSSVGFEVMPEGAAFDTDHFSPRLSDVPCTSEQAAAWD